MGDAGAPAATAGAPAATPVQAGFTTERLRGAKGRNSPKPAAAAMPTLFRVRLLRQSDSMPGMSDLSTSGETGLGGRTGIESAELAKGCGMPALGFPGLGAGDTML